MKIRFVLFERTLEMIKELRVYSFSISLFVLEILRFVWYVNNTLHTSHCTMSCWETMYMIEIILLNQSKLSLLGVIRQIPLMRSFVCLCLITSTIFLLLQQPIIVPPVYFEWSARNTWILVYVSLLRDSSVYRITWSYYLIFDLFYLYVRALILSTLTFLHT